jgi:hypothetical protein
MLRIIIQQGHTDISPTFFGKLYHVVPSMICQDMDVLLEYLPKHFLRPQKIKSEAVAAKYRALQGALKTCKYAEANVISDSLLKMGYDLGILDKQAEKIETRIEGALTIADIKNAVKIRRQQVKSGK